MRVIRLQCPHCGKLWPDNRWGQKKVAEHEKKGRPARKRFRKDDRVIVPFGPHGTVGASKVRASGKKHVWWFQVWSDRPGGCRWFSQDSLKKE